MKASKLVRIFALSLFCIFTTLSASANTPEMQKIAEEEGKLLQRTNELIRKMMTSKVSASEKKNLENEIAKTQEELAVLKMRQVDAMTRLPLNQVNPDVLENILIFIRRSCAQPKNFANCSTALSGAQQLMQRMPKVDDAIKREFYLTLGKYQQAKKRPTDAKISILEGTRLASAQCTDKSLRASVEGVNMLIELKDTASADQYLQKSKECAQTVGAIVEKTPTGFYYPKMGAATSGTKTSLPNTDGNFAVKLPRAPIGTKRPTVAELLRHGRFEPLLVDKAINGYKIISTQPNSMYEKMELKAGDEILYVDNEACTNPTTYSKIFHRYANENDFSLIIRREGKLISYKYSF